VQHTERNLHIDNNGPETSKRMFDLFQWSQCRIHACSQLTGLRWVRLNPPSSAKTGNMPRKNENVITKVILKLEKYRNTFTTRVLPWTPMGEFKVLVTPQLD